MNRIILIGNGFDLAHGLKTSYKDFINNTWTNKARFCGEQGSYYDENDDIEFSYKKNFVSYDFHELFKCNDYTTLRDFTKARGINIKFKNNFLEQITTNCGLNNWIDIEKEFYDALKECLKERLKAENKINLFDNNNNIEELNKDFERIKFMLSKYLTGIEIKSELYNSEIHAKMVSEFQYRDFTQAYKKQYIQEKTKYIISVVDSVDDPLKESDENIKNMFQNRSRINPKGIEKVLNSSDSIEFFPDLLINNLLFVNFNYTSTYSLYKKDIQNSRTERNRYHNCQPDIHLSEINIHGELNNPNNPMIFGFGDEIDEDYSKIENLDDNRFLENIKSTKYHETGNYKKLLEYIDSDYFQIFIFGHSCGLSDRTLLSTLFNHKNCVSIKPFFHKKDDGTDNYSDLVRNISRHFKNKASLRDKVVNKTYCEPLTGSK